MIPQCASYVQSSSIFVMVATVTPSASATSRGITRSHCRGDGSTGSIGRRLGPTLGRHAASAKARRLVVRRNHMGDSCRDPEKKRRTGLRQVTLKEEPRVDMQDRKSTRLNSSHPSISYAVF